MGQIDNLKERLQLLATKVDGTVEGVARGADRDGELQQLKFTVNRMVADYQMLKGVCKEGRIDKIEDEIKKVQEIEYVI